jgi:GH35 family endo-1,4-beta-xylanase
MIFSMKLKNILPLMLAALLVGLNGCYDEKMAWGDPYSHPATQELPLPLQEKIARYEASNAYTTATLGAGINFNLYTTDETYRNLVNQNFDEITPSNELKQDALMKNDGTLDFSRADVFINDLLAQGQLTIYGHTLVWHNQQKAGYLNSLIAPAILPGPAGSSLIDGSFEEGMDAWSPNFNAQDYSINTDEHLDGVQSLKAVIGSGAAGKYDAQLTSPSFPIISGHHYEISIWIKCSGQGEIGLDFPNGELGNQYPWTNGAELATVGSTWTEVKYNTDLSGGSAMIATADNAAMTFRLLLGKVASVDYYIDNVTVIDLDAVPQEINLVENGNFESGELNPWATSNQGAGISVSEEAKYDGTYGLKAVSGASSSNEWDLQFQTPEITLDPSKFYSVSFMVKSDVEGSARISYSGFSNNYPWTNWDGTGAAAQFATSSLWKEITYDLATDYTDPSLPKIKLSFDFGKLPNVTYYIDNVKVVEKQAVAASIYSFRLANSLYAGPIIIEKTPEEKRAILDPVFRNYITEVASHYAGKIVAWDVVNEPMNENGTVRTGEENLQSASTFYWQYYLGNEYAVTAFKAAKIADPNAKLFINEYNLESASGLKLDGLLEYVEYIENNGAQIDGIGTQMHLNINWIDTTSIERMFQKLAATGKLIKISELDIAISQESNPASPVQPTAEQYERQAELYRFVANAYTQYIPENQRYGITLWGVSDNENEHQYWLTNDAPCLWNAKYERKHAYKSFCDGLAGRDVSADFSGELVY